MALFKSGNPVLNEKTFEKSFSYTGTDTMTVNGTLNKFGILFLLTLAAAGYSWKMVYSGVDITPYIWPCVLTTLGIAILLVFKMEWAPYLAPVYAIVKGFAVGVISAFYNHAFDKISPNIITQAVCLTFGVVIAMFLLYRFNIIKATQTFKKIVLTATMGLAVFYLIAIGLRFANIDIPFLHEGSPIGIVFSLVVVALAAMNLIIDFDMIENHANQGAPKFMEWYGAFALLVTIIWLYIEVLRLLAKIAGSRK